MSFRHGRFGDFGRCLASYLPLCASKPKHEIYSVHPIVILELRSTKCKQLTNVHGKEHHRRVVGRAPAYSNHVFSFFINAL